MFLVIYEKTKKLKEKKEEFPSASDCSCFLMELLLVHYRGGCPVDCSGPRGWRTLHLGVGPLVCLCQGCLCGGAPCSRGPGALSSWSDPKGGFFLALGLGARPCLCLIGAVGLNLCVHVCVRACMCACVCVCLSLCLSGYLWGW